MPTRNSPRPPLAPAPSSPPRPRAAARPPAPAAERLAPALLAALGALGACGSPPASPPPPSAPAATAPSAPSAPSAVTAAPPPVPATVSLVAQPPDPEPPTPPGWCKGGRRIFTKTKAYCLVEEPLNWEEARRRCAVEKGMLAQPTTTAEQEALRGKLSTGLSAEGSFWLGLSRDDQDTWRWVDGAAMSVARWSPNEPNNAGNERCVEVYRDTGLWNDLSCQISLPFLCRLPRAPAATAATGGFRPFRCPGKVFRVGEADFCFHETPGSWENARVACAASGGDLAMFQGEAEQRAMLASPGSPLRLWRVWLGLTDQAAEGVWRWDSGQPAAQTDWHPGEPNNAGGEHCAELRGDHWNDLACGSKMPSLCQTL